MNKFPVFRTIKNSFAFIFENHRHALKMIWPYALILSAIYVPLEFAATTGDEDIVINADFIISCILIAALILLGFLAIALTSLAWQRAHLNGLSPDNQPHPLHLTRDEWRFVGIHTLTFLLLTFGSYAILTTLFMFFIMATMDYHLVSTLIIGGIALAIIAVASSIGLLGVRLLVYLPAIAQGRPLTLKQSFRLARGGTWRLAMTCVLLGTLFTGAYWAINFKPLIESSQRAAAFGYQDEMRENMREAQIANGEPVTVPEELPNKADFMDPPPTLIDFLFYIPANVILNLLSALVAAGIFAQFYRWAMENRRE